MIPKVIHYCWFGGNPLPDFAKKCIASWKKYFPDYEIRQWNEENFDFSVCAYAAEAYQAKKWAFVSDYARFQILHDHGGLYFDTDVEVIRDFSDILEKGAFMGCEDGGDCAPGLGLGALPGMPLYKEVLELYHNVHFINPDGSYNLRTVVEYMTEVLHQHGFQGAAQPEQVMDVTIYPPEYFCPMNPVDFELIITDKTHSIHHYAASWVSDFERFKNNIQRLIGPKLTKKIQLLKKRIKGDCS